MITKKVTGNFEKLHKISNSLQIYDYLEPNCGTILVLYKKKKKISAESPRIFSSRIVTQRYAIRYVIPSPISKTKCKKIDLIQELLASR